MPKLATVKKTVDLQEVVVRGGLVIIPGVKSEKFVTLIVGDRPLIINKFSAKAMTMMEDKQTGKAMQARQKKVPVECYNAARHRLSDGSDGYPAGGMKAAIVAGFSKETGIPMTRAKGGVRVATDDPVTNLVRIICPNEPVMRTDGVRNATGVADIRYRPEYWPWAMRLEIEYLPGTMSIPQVLQAVSVAGWTNGLGEMRPASRESKSGTYGTFRIATPEEVDLFERGSLFSPVVVAMPTKKRAKA